MISSLWHSKKVGVVKLFLLLVPYLFDLSCIIFIYTSSSPFSFTKCSPVVCKKLIRRLFTSMVCFSIFFILRLTRVQSLSILHNSRKIKYAALFVLPPNPIKRENWFLRENWKCLFFWVGRKMFYVLGLVVLLLGFPSIE